MQELSVDLETQIYATFLEDINQQHLTLLPVEDKHLDSASHLISMLPTHSLRTLDAMHLAIAQHHGLQRIATADALFAKAAEALGFVLDVFQVRLSNTLSNLLWFHNDFCRSYCRDNDDVTY